MHAACSVWLFHPEESKYRGLLRRIRSARQVGVCHYSAGHGVLARRENMQYRGSSTAVRVTLTKNVLGAGGVDDSIVSCSSTQTPETFLIHHVGTCNTQKKAQHTGMFKVLTVSYRISRWWICCAVAVKKSGKQMWCGDTILSEEHDPVPSCSRSVVLCLRATSCQQGSALCVDSTNMVGNTIIKRVGYARLRVDERCSCAIWYETTHYISMRFGLCCAGREISPLPHFVSAT